MSRPRHEETNINTSILTTLLTSDSRILIEKLIVAQMIIKFEVIYGTHCFSIVFRRVHHPIAT
jgi:hypothetical protein